MPTPTPRTEKLLVLIDGNSLLYRGFFAMRALTTSAGQPTNAVFSFTMMLLTLLSDQKPDVIICAWDAPARTFRHEEFAEYKGQRQSTPPELVEQAPLAREMTEAFRIPMLEAPGYEADDIIGTLARRGRDAGYTVLIVTGDLDALQLVEPGVRVMTTIKGVTDTVIYDEAAVVNRYGLNPDQLTDYRALKGDTSDNIPGVPGVGEKTATQLLQQYGTIENLIPHIAEVKQNKLREALGKSVEQMTLSKRLATIVRDVPLEGESTDIPALDSDPHTPDYAKVRALFERLEFRTLLRRIPEVSEPSGSSSSAPGSAETAGVHTSFVVDLNADDYDPFAVSADNDLPAATPTPVAPSLEFQDVVGESAIDALVAKIRKSRRVGLRLHHDGEGMDANLRGIAFALDGNVEGDSAENNVNTVYYLPIASAAGVGEPIATVSAEPTSLFDEPVEDEPETAIIPPAIISLLEDTKIPKATHDSKADFALLMKNGVTLRGIVFDTELAAYLLNAGRRSGYPLNEIAADYASRSIPLLETKQRKEMAPEEIAAHDKTRTQQEAEAILATMRVQEPRLASDNLMRVLETLDLPVAPILAEMERAGVRVDVGVLNRTAAEMQAKITQLEGDIFTIAGEKFSIGSTKQLQHILFEKLQLPAGKKTKTGYSTGADVLEELAPDYPIVSLIMQHRELTKLKNTYAEAMPALVRRDTGRIHTTLNQTVAATGRLSSSNPNLQNIPIRTAVGREIRRAFIAAPGCVLISADYSQIELRLFAHVSHDPELVAAFSSGEDIHKYTASRIYGVSPADVTGDMRRNAKTVNYAVIYGISEFALARLLSISMAEAKELKSSYFARFPGVRTYLDQTVEFARENGYVETLFGRRRYMPDINSRVFQFRQAAERAAANMPIQGSSADIMKLAMIKVHEMLQADDLTAKMLLQVHDELLFECPPDEVQRLAPRVHHAMTTVYPLAVALDVEVKTGATWADVTPVEDADDNGTVDTGTLSMEGMGG